jgi:hypothetical protein
LIKGSRIFILAPETSSAHSARMAEAPALTIDVAEDDARPGRYRWNVSENMKVRDKSLYSFGTKLEAQLDAVKFALSLNGLWPPASMIKPPKRPRDLNEWAKRMVDIATGEVEDQSDKMTLKRASKAGSKGGPASALVRHPQARRPK